MNPTVDLVGQPIQQGSMTCVGRNGRHQLISDNKPLLKPWRALVARGGAALAGRVGGPILAGPVAVEITITVPRGSSITLAARRWPWKKSPSAGDVDKHARAVLDGLTGPLLNDDAQVCELHIRKVYPDTFDVLDSDPGPYPWTTAALPQPGASISIRKL